MKVYITSTFKNGENQKEIEDLCSIVNRSGFEDFSFIRDIENFEKTFDDPKELMLKAKETLIECDALLIDMTHKPTGRAIEAGMAFAEGKKIITILQKGTEIKDTTVGISDIIIEYESIEDIEIPLSNFLKEQNI